MSDSEEDTQKPVVETKEEDGVDTSGMSKKKLKKHKYRLKLLSLFDEYQGILIVGIDNVGSHQMQKVRMALRGQAVVLMGKNTLMRLVIREKAKTMPELRALLPLCKGNMGFVFSNADLNVIRKLILDNKVPAAAKSGSIAPVDVFVPPGPTGMDPGQTAFFQALNIATKIQRGSIEIIDTVHLIAIGDKVSSSAVALLNKLNIKPFSYGIKVNMVYDKGAVYAAAILDLDESDMINKFMNAVAQVAAISIAIGYPTTASVPFQVRDAFKKICAIALEVGYSFAELEELKSGASKAKAKAAAPKVEEKEAEEEEDESSDAGMGFDMFGGGGGDDDEEEEDEEEDGEE